MIKNDLISQMKQSFSECKQKTKNDIACWFIHGIQYLLGYVKWGNSPNVIFNAKMVNCLSSNEIISWQTKKTTQSLQKRTNVATFPHCQQGG